MAGLKQRDVGTWLGFTQRTISQWEKEDIAPHASELEILTREFGDPLDEWRQAAGYDAPAPRVEAPGAPDRGGGARAMPGSPAGSVSQDLAKFVRHQREAVHCLTIEEFASHIEHFLRSVRRQGSPAGVEEFTADHVQQLERGLVPAKALLVLIAYALGDSPRGWLHHAGYTTTEEDDESSFARLDADDLAMVEVPVHGIAGPDGIVTVAEQPFEVVSVVALREAIRPDYAYQVSGGGMGHYRTDSILSFAELEGLDDLLPGATVDARVVLASTGVQQIREHVLAEYVAEDDTGIVLTSFYPFRGKQMLRAAHIHAGLVEVTEITPLGQRLRMTQSARRASLTRD